MVGFKNSDFSERASDALFEVRASGLRSSVNLGVGFSDILSFSFRRLSVCVIVHFHALSIEKSELSGDIYGAHRNLMF